MESSEDLARAESFARVFELTRCVLPGMREKRRGKIINISLVGGMMAMPTMSVYSAS
ncbi:SDR family NAD(P)-dependent oxidoreductase [Rhodopirellula sp. JC639]|uniref:SDR family NAD(P)-dependent oxidoreductase n=1 Tax=Stieleria mannarensis TaxID=2755585 RepID=UPI00256FF7A8|nr:SDR family NAD(P)-dependent oxidoreductase [Rhodopirellula sp. JC639]